MSKTTELINAGTDTTVLSTGGTLLKLLGDLGNPQLRNTNLVIICFNAATAAACGTARWRAESLKDHPLQPGQTESRIRRVLRDSKAPLIIISAFQACMVVGATWTAFHDHKIDYEFIKKIAIPGLFSVGSYLGGRSARQAFFRSAAQDVTASVKTATKKTVNAFKFAATYVFSRPNAYWAGGMALAADALAPVVIFAAAFVLEAVQALHEARETRAEEKPRRWGRLGRVLHDEQTPLLMQTAASFVAAALYAHAGDFRNAAALCFYGLGYATYAADQKYHGVVEWGRTMLHGRKQSLSARSAAPGLK